MQSDLLSLGADSVDLSEILAMISDLGGKDLMLLPAPQTDNHEVTVGDLYAHYMRSTALPGPGSAYR